MRWDYFIYRTISGREFRIGYLNRSGEVRETNWVLDKWMRAKLYPQSIKLEDWREFCVWDAETCVFLGDVESIKVDGWAPLGDNA